MGHSSSFMIFLVLLFMVKIKKYKSSKRFFAGENEKKEKWYCLGFLSLSNNFSYSKWLKSHVHLFLTSFIFNCQSCSCLLVLDWKNDIRWWKEKTFVTSVFKAPAIWLTSAWCRCSFVKNTNETKINPDFLWELKGELAGRKLFLCAYFNKVSFFIYFRKLKSFLKSPQK